MKIIISSPFDIPHLDIIEVEYPQGMYSEKARITHHFGNVVHAQTYMILPHDKEEIKIEASL